MLKAHIDSVENSLLATSLIQENSGHTLHKGTPREAFIKEFLDGHLSERVAIGTGEIIDSNSRPGESRNQIDIVIYKRDYPKIDFGGGISGFLAESVVATIEVKSTLDAAELTKAMKSASRTKKYKRNIHTSFHAGYSPPSILSYVVAYDGPVNMSTIHGWIKPAYVSIGISDPPMGVTGDERLKIISPSLDGIFVLGKGFIAYDNAPIGFSSDSHRAQHPSHKWTVAQADRGSLLMLFMLLTASVSGVSGSWLDPIPYLSRFNISNLSTNE